MAGFRFPPMRGVAVEAACALAGLLVAGCVTAPPCPDPAAHDAARAPADPVRDESPADALRSFLDAVAVRDFEAAYRLMAAPQRARYTPARLGDDYAAVQSLATDKLVRARAALDAPARVDGARAEFGIGEGRAVRLVREPDGWKIEALE